MTTQPIRTAARAAILGIVVNLLLALIKIATGLLGHSYALIADGIESTADILTSLIVFAGLAYAQRPPDREHPYGHGKAEPLVAMAVAAALLAAAALIAVQSVHEIARPHHSPAWFTLPVLLVVVVTKEALSRFVLSKARALESTALTGDAWHHRSDALTSAAAFVGISIALIGGPGYQAADDWAALAACAIITFNGLNLARTASHELLDRAPSEELHACVRAIAQKVPGVLRVEKCHIRKYGLAYIVDLHIEVDPQISVRQGHDIAHRVKDALLQSPHKIENALIHIEPATPQ